MPRYVTRPKADADCDWWSAGSVQPVPTVGDSEATDTGLLDAQGNCIYRVNPPIGFGRDDEW